MNREYHRWFSPVLKRNMELLVFGHSGAPVLFFPTRTAHFYDYENYRVIDAIADKINNGYIQVYCVDSIDAESFYCECSHPSQRIIRHNQYEQYILNEVLPLVRYKNPNHFIISAGCSLGAYHAVNIALRHPHLFGKVVGLSGRYDLTIATKSQIDPNTSFEDLFSGYRDENVYLNMPTQFMPNLTDESILRNIRRLEISLVVGLEDPFYPNNKFLHDTLQSKGVHSGLYIWEGEAHRSTYWRQMVKCYL
jgi:esterase/lipase superfamily enzyme